MSGVPGSAATTLRAPLTLSSMVWVKRGLPYTELRACGELVATESLSSRAQRGTFSAASKVPRCARDDSNVVTPDVRHPTGRLDRRPACKAHGPRRTPGACLPSGCAA